MVGSIYPHEGSIYVAWVEKGADFPLPILSSSLCGAVRAMFSLNLRPLSAELLLMN